MHVMVQHANLTHEVFVGEIHFFGLESVPINLNNVPTKNCHT